MKKHLILPAIGFSIVAFLTSCSLTVDPDGTRNWSVSGSEIVKGIIIYADK